MWYIDTIEYYSSHKKEQSRVICSNMVGPKVIILSEGSQRKTKTISLATAESKLQAQITYETDSDIERLVVAKGRGWAYEMRGWGQQAQKLLYREWISNRVYCRAQGYIQYPDKPCGKGYKEECI